MVNHSCHRHDRMPSSGVNTLKKKGTDHDRIGGGKVFHIRSPKIWVSSRDNPPALERPGRASDGPVVTPALAVKDLVPQWDGRRMLRFRPLPPNADCLVGSAAGEGCRIERTSRNGGGVEISPEWAVVGPAAQRHHQHQRLVGGGGLHRRGPEGDHHRLGTVLLHGTVRKAGYEPVDHSTADDRATIDAGVAVVEILVI